MRYVIIFAACLYGLTSCAQADKNIITLIAPSTESFLFSLGNKKIELKKSVYDTEDAAVFVQLHHNENTAKNAAVAYLQQNGGVFYSLENNGERNISFRLKGKTYTFDPNRMFTRRGITSSLKLYGPYSKDAADRIEQFARFVLSKIPSNKPVIAVHNNTDKRYSINSYLHDKTYAVEAAEVVKNMSEDADNFFITTDSKLHLQLKSLNFNTILLNLRKLKNDGSLSYYYSLHNRPYINVETEEGKVNQQIKMVQAVTEVLK